LSSRNLGTFDGLKWRTPLSAAFPRTTGHRDAVYTWRDAVLDTASPVHILPGTCPTLRAREDARADAELQVRLNLKANQEVVSLVSHEIYHKPIGGVEGVPRWRYLFWTVLDIPGIPNLDFAPVIFMDIPHPIISVGLCVETGMRFTFDARGFSAR